MKAETYKYWNFKWKWFFKARLINFFAVFGNIAMNQIRYEHPLDTDKLGGNTPPASISSMFGIWNPFRKRHTVWFDSELKKSYQVGRLITVFLEQVNGTFKNALNMWQLCEGLVLRSKTMFSGKQKEWTARSPPFISEGWRDNQTGERRKDGRSAQGHLLKSLMPTAGARAQKAAAEDFEDRLDFSHFTRGLGICHRGIAFAREAA